MDIESLKKKYTLQPVEEKKNELEKELQDALLSHKDITQLSLDLHIILSYIPITLVLTKT
jgi:hypothetical protein